MFQLCKFGERREQARQRNLQAWHDSQVLGLTLSQDILAYATVGPSLAREPLFSLADVTGTEQSSR